MSLLTTEVTNRFEIHFFFVYFIFTTTLRVRSFRAPQSHQYDEWITYWVVSEDRNSVKS